MKLKNIFQILIATLFFTTLFATGREVKPRVAGLEGNQEYMSLLVEEHKLLVKEDSIVSVVAEMRERYRQNVAEREHFREEIVRLENEVFDVRNSAGIIASKINRIEQEYILANLDNEPIDGALGGDDREELGTKADTLANLIYNNFFKQNLPLMDYDALLTSQLFESKCRTLTEDYMKRYGELASLFTAYQEADNQEQADSIMELYRHCEELGFVIEDRLTESWDYVVDNKLYCYNYLFDRLNMMEQLSHFEQKLNEATDAEAQLRKVSQSPVIAAYPVQKQLIFDYEKELAQLLEVAPALDSLQKAERAFAKMTFEAPLLEMRERLFIDYGEVEVHSPSIYNSSNPIPECEVYERGVIYRLLVGTYWSKQSIATFRGVAPVGYIRGEDKRFRYYIGGFETLTEAKEGLEKLKERGFRSPKIVVWDYGVYSEFDDEGELQSDSDKLYRVEIGKAGEDLSVEVKEALERVAENKDILRVGDQFFVTPFEAPSQAEAVAEVVRQTDRRLQVKISEVPL